MPASMRATPLSSFNTPCWYIHTRSHMTKVTHAERKEYHTSALWGITSGLKPEATQVPHPVQTTTCFSTHFQCFPCIDMHQHCHRDSDTELEAHANGHRHTAGGRLGETDRHPPSAPQVTMNHLARKRGLHDEACPLQQHHITRSFPALHHHDVSRHQSVGGHSPDPPLLHHWGQPPLVHQSHRLQALPLQCPDQRRRYCCCHEQEQGWQPVVLLVEQEEDFHALHRSRQVSGQEQDQSRFLTTLLLMCCIVTSITVVCNSRITGRCLSC